MKHTVLLLFLSISLFSYAQDSKDSTSTTNSARMNKTRQNYGIPVKRKTQVNLDSLAAAQKEQRRLQRQLEEEAEEAARAQPSVVPTVKRSASKTRANFGTAQRRSQSNLDSLQSVQRARQEAIDKKNKYRTQDDSIAAAKKLQQKHRDNFTVATQDREDAEQPKVKVLSKLSKAKGSIDAPWGDEIFERDREIKGLDNFERFEFQTLQYGSGSCFVLRKQYRTGYFGSSNMEKGFKSSTMNTIWVLDPTQYKETTSDLSGGENVIKLDITLKRVMAQGDKFPALYDLENVDKSQLVIKYRQDRSLKKILFIVYVLEENGKLVSGLNNAEGNDIFLTAEEKVMADKFRVITATRMFEDFYYEADYTEFMAFLKGARGQ